LPIPAGTRLGPYEIAALIGSGGMGEVYRARDTKLARDVAIKSLPALFTRDPDRLARFHREAQVLASLNHPHIAHIYGLEEADGVEFLALELVEGETLANRIARGALPLDEALPIARQIADALAAAHERGIVHRDLKPANVAITPDSQVKVLDFGLAKVLDPDPSLASPAVSAPPTMTSPAMTARGIVLGTAAYMSPEQAKGRPADKRSDIWAFGLIVFEMLAGRQVFVRETMTETVAAVIHDEIPWSALPQNIPEALRRTLVRCLQKDPSRRLHSAADAGLDLEDASRAPEPAAAAPGVRRRSPGWLLGTAMALLYALGTIVLALVLGHISRVSPQWARFAAVTDREGEQTQPSVAADGKSIAYVIRSARDDETQIAVQRVGGHNPIVVARGSVNAPAFSPDGQRIAYAGTTGAGSIFVVGATGESSRRVTDFGFNPSWSPDGTKIVFSSVDIDQPFSRAPSTASLWVVEAAAGAPKKIFAGDALQPAWSRPLGKRIAFWASSGNGQRDIYTIPAQGGDPVPVTNDEPTDWAPAWSPDGRFLYFSSDRGGPMGLWRTAIDERSGRTTGQPELVLAGVGGSTIYASLSSDDSVLAFESLIRTVNPIAFTFDPATGQAGTVRALSARNGRLAPTDVSPDGRLLLLSNLGEQQEDVLISNTDLTDLRRVTDDPAKDRGPSFAPDGRILFYSNRDGDFAPWSIAQDGGGLRKVGEIRGIYPSMSPRGDRITVYTITGGRGAIASIVNGTAVDWKPIAPEGTRFSPASWSRDARHVSGVAYFPPDYAPTIGIYDADSGTLSRVPDAARAFKAPINQPGVVFTMHWLPDNRHIVYITSDHRLAWTDTITGETKLSDVIGLDTGSTLAVSPDGRTLYSASSKTEADIWIARKR
jgi:serine/threonine-protein kinase